VETNEYTFKTKVWLWETDKAPASWHFISVPPKYAIDIKDIFQSNKRGFGSLRVKATIGNTTWNTSIFPDNKSDTYLLPLKKDVREKEKISVGQTKQVKISIIID
jgi:hypothetical protein